MQIPGRRKERHASTVAVVASFANGILETGPCIHRRQSAFESTESGERTAGYSQSDTVASALDDDETACRAGGCVAGENLSKGMLVRTNEARLTLRAAGEDAPIDEERKHAC